MTVTGDPIPALECQGVTKRYGARTVLEEVTFTIGPGERVGLMGPSGSGKSTLLNCLGGIDRPDAGSVRIAGTRLDALSSEGLAQLRRRTVSTIFQFFHLLPTLTAAENVEFPLQLLGQARGERLERVRQLLAEVNLTARADALPSQLSGGELQRVAIARALAGGPKLILADEPTGNLDTINGGLVLDLLARLTAEYGTALLLVTHSAEATRICGRVLQLRDGRLL